MMETNRVVLNIRFLLIVAVLIGFLFIDFYSDIRKKVEEERIIEELNSQYTDEVIIVGDSSEKPDVNYKQEYHNEIDRILKRAESLLERSDNKLERAKIKKTSQDFKMFEDIEVQECNESALTNVTEYRLASVILVFIGIILIASFFEERKRGLWYFVYSTVRGRSALTLRRLGILCITASMLVCMVYAGLFGINWYFEGIPDLTVSIQSYSDYWQLTERITLGQFLLSFIITKIISTIAILILIWFVISAIGDVGLGIVISALIIIVEIILHTLISPNEVGSIFRDINICYFLDTGDWFHEYILYGTKGMLLERRYILLLLALLISLGCSIGIVVKGVITRPFVYNGIYKRIIESNLVGRVVSKTPVWLTEYRKMLCWCGGFIVLVCVYIWSKNSFELSEITYKNSRNLKAHYYEMCEGKSLEWVEKFLDSKEQEAQNEDDARRSYIEDVIDSLRERVEYVKKQRALGREVYILDDEPYTKYYGYREELNRTIHTIIALSAIIIIMSNIWSFENKSNTIKSFFATKSGRKKLHRDKFVLILLSTFIVYAIVFGAYLYMHYHEYGFPFSELSIYNITTMADMKYDVTIRTYIIGGELLRGVLFLAAGLTTGLISRKLTAEKTMMIGMVIFVLPILLNIL